MKKPFSKFGRNKSVSDAELKQYFTERLQNTEFKIMSEDDLLKAKHQPYTDRMLANA